MNNQRDDAANAIIIGIPIVGSDECESCDRLRYVVQSRSIGDKVLDDNESSEEGRHIVRGIGSIVRGKGIIVVANAGAVATLVVHIS